MEPGKGSPWPWTMHAQLRSQPHIQKGTAVALENLHHLFADSNSEALLLLWAPPACLVQEGLEAGDRVSRPPLLHLLCCAVAGGVV